MTKAYVRAFYQGKREGVQEYAWWKDGTQYVGSTGTTLAQALKFIETEEYNEMMATDIEESDE